MVTFLKMSSSRRNFNRCIINYKMYLVTNYFFLELIFLRQVYKTSSLKIKFNGTTKPFFIVPLIKL